MNKKILLAIGYVAGIAIALKYKSKENNKKFSEDFIDIHKSLFNEIKDSSKTKDFLNNIEKKVYKFKKEGYKVLDSMPDRSKENLEKAKQKLEDIYNNKQDYLNKAKVKARDFIKNKELRENIFLDMKNILNKKYNTILKKLEK